MKLSKEIVARIYRLEAEKSPMLARTLQLASKTVYENVEKYCTYVHDGKRLFKTGGTPALKSALDTLRAFVLEVDSTGTISMATFDSLLWACHNNGTLADKFLKCDGEYDAIQFLSGLSGTVRTGG